MKFSSVISVLLCALSLAGCNQPGQWTLAYRDQPADGAWRYSEVAGFYQTLDQCKAKGDGMLRLNQDKGEYLCAMDCETQDELLVCQTSHQSTAGALQ